MWTADMPLSATAWHKPPADATIEQYVATLDQQGIQYAVLAAASLFDDYNEYSIEAGRRHKRLRTTAIVKPTIDPYVMRMMKDDGVVGVRLQWRHVKDIPDIATPEYRKFFRRVRYLDWHVHINQTADKLAAPIATLQAAGVKLVIDHFGEPDPSHGINQPGFQAVLAIGRETDAIVKLSAPFRTSAQPFPHSDVEPFVAAIVEVFGVDRCVWGSDWPFINTTQQVEYGDLLTLLTRWLPNQADQERVLWHNPARFLGFTECC